MKNFIKTIVSYCALIASLGNSVNAMEMASASPKLADITQTAIKTYEAINKNWSYPTDSQTPVGYTDSWEQLRVDISGQGWASAIVWNYVKQPSFSKALEEIINTKLVMECSNAAKITRLAIIWSVIGDSGMLKLVSNLKEKHSSSKYDLMSALSWEFFKKTENDTDSRQIYAYPFVNLSSYKTYKNGFDANHNVIKIPNNLYLGFAPDFFNTGQTLDALTKYLYDCFKNSSNVKPEATFMHARFCKMLNYDKFKKMRSRHQCEIGFFVFDIDEAELFANTHSVT